VESSGPVVLGGGEGGMFFNLGEELRERGEGPWASAWRVERFLASGRHFRHYQVRALAAGREEQRAALLVARYDPRRLREADGLEYVRALRARLRRGCEALSHVSPRLPEPLDWFEVDNAQDPFEGFGVQALRASEPVFVRTALHGVSLARLMEERGAPPASAEVLLLALAKVCGFLEELHAGGRGWLMGDLSPEHVWVEPEQEWEPSFAGASGLRAMRGGVAQADGLEEVLGAASSCAELGYAAPELLEGQEAGARADLYGVGALLFHLFSGVDPRGLAEGVAQRRGWGAPERWPSAWRQPGEAQGFAQELRDEVEVFCRRNLKGLGLSRARVRSVLLRSLEPDPARRPQSAAEVREELLAALPRAAQGGRG
jgi:serine/threonine protein kinase